MLINCQKKSEYFESWLVNTNISNCWNFQVSTVIYLWIIKKYKNSVKN